MIRCALQHELAPAPALLCMDCRPLRTPLVRGLFIALFATLLALTTLSPALADEGDEGSAAPETSSASAATSIDESNDNLVDPTQRADNSFIYDTTIATLLEQSSLYEERTVQVVGEVIGDRISENPGRCWVMITETNEDDPASFSVLMSDELANPIDHYGRYGVVGTTIQVRGTYHQACSEHDGQSDIHATICSVLSHGIEHPDEFNPNEFFPGIIAVIIGVLIMGVYYFARERAR